MCSKFFGGMKKTLNENYEAARKKSIGLGVWFASYGHGGHEVVENPKQLDISATIMSSQAEDKRYVVRTFSSSK